MKTILEHLPHGGDHVEMNRRVYLVIAKVKKDIRALQHLPYRSHTVFERQIETCPSIMGL